MAKKAAAIKKGSEGKGIAPEVKSLKSKVTLVVSTTYKDYLEELTPRQKLIDIFLCFLVALGVLQFIFAVLIGNYPFNGFLGGFISCVGQFVLTVSLRLQYSTKNNGTEEQVVGEQSELDTNSGEDSDAAGQTTRVERKPFTTLTPERAFGDYIFASLILHFAVYHFIN